MRKFRIGFVCVIAMLLGALGGCAPRQVVPRPVSGGLNQTFVLRVGQTATIRDRPLEITFKDVFSDSRCPTGAMCIVAGEVVMLLLAQVANNIKDITFHVRPGGDAHEFAGYTIRVTQIDPPKGPPETMIAENQYVAYIQVRAGKATSPIPISPTTPMISPSY